MMTDDEQKVLLDPEALHYMGLRVRVSPWGWSCPVVMVSDRPTNMLW